jgi:carbamoylphosphate synthase large subunit
MARKRKTRKLTAEDRARFDETMRRLRARIAERERLEEKAADAREPTQPER